MGRDGPHSFPSRGPLSLSLIPQQTLSPFPLWEGPSLTPEWPTCISTCIFLSTYHVPGTLLRVGDSIINKTDKVPAFQEFPFYSERQLSTLRGNSKFLSISLVHDTYELSSLCWVLCIHGSDCLVSTG